jgi:hypothetical protein
MNNGAGGATTSPVDTATIDNKPYLSEYTISSGLILVGSTYNFNIRADNEIGYIQSDDVSIVLAEVPDDPTNAPTQDFTETSST